MKMIRTEFDLILDAVKSRVNGLSTCCASVRWERGTRPVVESMTPRAQPGSGEISMMVTESLQGMVQDSELWTFARTVGRETGLWFRVWNCFKCVLIWGYHCFKCV